ncbi:hypothetical protein GCM10025762_04980 [Haloechinothrix salitolerans]
MTRRGCGFPRAAWRGSRYRRGRSGPVLPRRVGQLSGGFCEAGRCALVALAVRDPPDAGNGVDLLTGVVERVYMLDRCVDSPTWLNLVRTVVLVDGVERVAE